KGWSDVFARLVAGKDAEVRRLSQSLAATFGDPAALDALRRVLADAKADPAARQAALATLVGSGDRELVPLLHRLVADAELRGAALRALASYDDPKTPEVVLAVFGTLSAQEKRDALNTLASRVAYGKALMEAVAAKKVAANDVPAEVVRQLRTLNDVTL